MKAYKISDVNVSWLKEFGDNPNQAITNLRVTQEGNLGNLNGLPKSSHNPIEGNPKGTQADAVILKQSVADLRLKLNTILKEIYNKIQLVNNRLDTVQSDMQEEFNERLNRFLLNALNNRLETMREQIIKQCLVEVNKTLKS